jgi:outer membrane lipoprotein-sorting protein
MGLRTMISIILMIFSTTHLCCLPDVTEIMRQMEKAQEMDTDVTARVTFTQQKADQGVKVYESIYYRRDSDDAFLIVMIAPETEKGNGYLRVGDNFWWYRRNTRTFQHINRDETISGTDARAGDLEKRKFTELYEPALDQSGKEIISEETLGKAGIPVYRFEIKAKVNDITYPKQILWVTRDNYLPLKIESYSLSGTLLQTGYFRKYTSVEGKYIPVQQLFIDEFEKGNKTIFELAGISLKELDDSIFTKAYLENLSK